VALLNAMQSCSAPGSHVQVQAESNDEGHCFVTGSRAGRPQFDTEGVAVIMTDRKVSSLECGQLHAALKFRLSLRRYLFDAELL
jgi:hypothetical protein